MPISPRRLMRWAAVVVAIIVAVVACWHDTAYAHGGGVTTPAAARLAHHSW